MRIHKLPALLAATAATAFLPSARGQLPTIANGHLLANATGSTAPAGDTAPSPWFDQAYCSTAGYLIVRFTGAWTCAQGIPANPVWWGADPTGSSDSSSAFSSALNASSYVRFPPGKFKFNSAVSYSIPAGIKSLTIEGAGADNTILYWPNTGGGLTINYNNYQSSSHTRNLSITTGTTNGGAGLTLALSAVVSDPAVFSLSDILNVTVRGDDAYAGNDYWTTGITVTNVTYTNIDNTAVYGGLTNNGTGLLLQGYSGSYLAGANISHSTFVELGNAVVYGSYVQGITVYQSAFIADNIGIISLAGESGTLDGLLVSGCELTTNDFGVITQTKIDNTQIIGNAFTNVSANGVGIDLNPNNAFIVSGNLLSSTSLSGTDAIVISDSMTLGIIAENLIGSWANGIVLGAGATYVNVQSNAFGASVSVPITNAGTNNVIANNIGYNPVGVTSAIYATPSTSTYTAGASPETHYLTGGAVSAIKVPTNAGTTICASTPCTVDLGPYETMSITYTAAPSDTKSIH